MKTLFVLLMLSTVAVLVALVAMWWRLRRDLRKSDEVLEEALQENLVLQEQEMEPELEPVER